jgi:GNAT superfamily N-acetyltransferase
VVFGLERVTTAWDELTELGEQEWAEVGDNERLGMFNPDMLTAMKHEHAGRIGAVTVRDEESCELLGYFIWVLGKPLKTAGKEILNEVGIYLTGRARTGWTAAKLLDYVEDVARLVQADAVICSHRPEHARIGKLYERRGFKPLSVDYVKAITRGL